MRFLVFKNAALISALLFLSIPSAFADIAKDDYQKSIRALTQKYGDTLVPSVFNMGNHELASFFQEMYDKEPFATEHSLSWWIQFRSVLERLAHNGSLQKEQPFLHHILNAPDTERRGITGELTNPKNDNDLLLVDSLANEKTGNYSDSLEDLRAYLQHKYKPAEWISGKQEKKACGAAGEAH